jgi:hypothetical protein
MNERSAAIRRRAEIFFAGEAVQKIGDFRS